MRPPAAGTPLVAIRDGRVVETGEDGGRGNHVAIWSPERRRTYVYLHMLHPARLHPGVACRPVDQMELRNRLVMATQMWKEATAEPLPRMAPGEPAEQLSAFEMRLIDMLCAQATADTARDVADKTWDLVHDRPDDDPVKRRVVECHEALARLSARGSGTGF